MSETIATLVEILTEARALIARGWCQETHAQDASGMSVPEWSPSACRWCVSGALWKTVADHEFNSATVDEGLRAICGAIGGLPPVHWNDTPGRTQAEVLDAFDRAIARARGEEQ